MNKSKLDKSTILLIVGILMALIAGVLIIKGQEYFNKLVPVVYCSNEGIAAYKTIKETDLVIIKIPKIVAQQQNIYTRMEDVIGKVTSTFIPSQTPIYKNQILSFNRNKNILAANLSQINDPGIVAYTIPTNQIACSGGKILSNDMVHIIATMEIPSLKGAAKTYVSKILVPYARVMDVVGKDANVKGLTFALTPQQVLDIELARKKGNISFALLPYNYNKDDGDISTSEESFINRHLSKKAGE